MQPAAGRGVVDSRSLAIQKSHHGTVFLQQNSQVRHWRFAASDGPARTQVDRRAQELEAQRVLEARVGEARHLLHGHTRATHREALLSESSADARSVRHEARACKVQHPTESVVSFSKFPRRCSQGPGQKCIRRVREESGKISLGDVSSPYHTV